MLAGAAGLIALAVTGHRGHETRQVGWVAPPEQTAPPARTQLETQADPIEQADPAEPTEPPSEENR